MKIINRSASWLLRRHPTNNLAVKSRHSCSSQPYKQTVHSAFVLSVQSYAIGYTLKTAAAKPTNPHQKTTTRQQTYNKPAIPYTSSLGTGKLDDLVAEQRTLTAARLEEELLKRDIQRERVSGGNRRTMSAKSGTQVR